MVTTAKGLRILTRPGHPDFLDLPWEQPLETWKAEHVVEVPRGVHRHVVRFVNYDGALYACKELPPRLVEREYRLLRKMTEENLPVVEAVGVVNRRALETPEGALEDVLVTRYLDYSLPYRLLFQHRRRQRILGDDPAQIRGLHDRLLDALASLLVRIHLTGFSWGDCSLSNTLFRRDAGALAAYMVDMETGEWHPSLSDGQRSEDLDITELNVAGGLMDLQAELELPPDPDPVETAHALRDRYEQLWQELTTDIVIGPRERYRIEGRIRRLNELGFDVDEFELVSTDAGDALRLHTSVPEEGHHRRRLLAITGLEAQENQARSLLNDIASFRVREEHRTGTRPPESVAVYRWLSEVFEPTVAAVPAEMREKMETVEVFHEVLQHKWFLSERAGRDVGIEDAAVLYVRNVLPAVPDERAVVASEEEAALGWVGYG